MTSRRVLAVLLVVLAVGSLVPPGVSQSGGESADLAISQPGYIDSDVEQFSTNGTNGYRVAGPSQFIKPQNFDSDDVVNAGVATQGGQLSYDSELDLYRFNPQGNNGTFELFWTVEEEVERTDGNETELVTEQRQYEATIRVTGQTDMEHQPAGTQSSVSEDAQQWREFNGTVTDIRESNLLLQGDQVTNDQIVESALNTYITSRDPARVLQGGFTQFHLMIVLGGVGFTAAVLFWAGIAVRAWRKEKKKNQRYESVEATEGALKDEVRQLDEQQRRQALNNWEFTDIAPNDHLADGLRALGDTPREAWERLSNEILLPEVWIRDKLVAMGQAGYVAEVLDLDDGVITDARLIKADDVDDEAETVELDGDMPEALFPICCTDDAFEGFDLEAASVDPTDMDSPRTLDIEALDEELERQLDWFDDPEQGADLLYEFVDAVANSRYTDDAGAPLPTQRALNEFLNEAQLLRDTFAFGLARDQANMIEHALASYDPAASAEQYRKDVEEGRV